MTSVTADVESAQRLIADAQKGNRIAADRLIRENEAWVRSVIYGITGRAEMVDDVAQQVWTRVWQRIDTLAEPAQLRSWLYAIARNAALDAMVARKRQQTTSNGLEDHPGPSDRQERRPWAVAAASEAHANILQAIQGLPAIYREPFVLRHLEEWSYPQIGEVLGLSVEAVETRLVRARRMLRESLQGHVER